MQSEHQIKRHNKSFLLYHLVCPVKYRRRAISRGVETTIKQICLEIEKRYEIHFVEIGTDYDHIHFLVQSVPTVSPKEIAQTIKSISAKAIFNQNPEVRKILWGGKFWTSGYYINTVGQYGNEQVISNYVKNQGRQYIKFYKKQLTLFN